MSGLRMPIGAADKLPHSFFFFFFIYFYFRGLIEASPFLKRCLSLYELTLLSSVATWDAIRSSNAPSGGSHGSPRSSIRWKPLSATWDAPDRDGNNKKTHCTTAGPAAAGAAASATAAASHSEPNQEIRELVPESQAYMDLLAFERKLDQTIMRKRVDIQEALKRPMKQKRKLRLYISNTFNPAKSDADDSDGSIASWELRVEGKLLDDLSKQKRKFSSFFKSLVIELDKDLYGPDNHLVEWHRTPTTQETDGFQVKRPGDVSVRCTLLLMLDYQPPQFKLDPRLARLLGIHTQTRSAIIQALWQYIKTNKLQDSHDKEYINCDKYFQQIFDCPRLKFSEIPQRLTNLLLPPDPIVINHIISVDPNDQKKTACYDIDVEVEDPLKGQMSSFLLSTANQQEITALDNKIHETIESINQLKIQRDFMLSFSKDPKGYIQDLLRSQSRDLKVMTDVVGNPEEERRAEFYHEPWSQEAVSRYFYCKIQQRRQELEQSLGVRNT
ncbi:SWI/SNF-related matrix-associated actin-dependent regulator of chromatin subfamily D member 3 isoform X1 [Pezoporus flaviventris]|uniref:SWI/SNF-related matrix-associated actin-dependent regulator of chromatin subfamily D member 3 isoform X1 n=1 Tax=Pezoporus flaviventris TaxID=889875 RepID=UPI002AB04B31|nr:SWI/SNF-related matrix-associated actin-dependent regulator of chromatin subfamily D member 3 isoform X1 [Pezoporus flaviventris]